MNEDDISRLDTQARILEAARSLFMELGFSNVTGDMLCKEARVSKTSLYKYFGDMEGVLIAVITQQADLFDLTIDTNPKTEAEFWHGLIGYGTRLLELLNSQFCVQVDRTMHEQARQNPDLAKRFYDNAYGRGHRDIATLIEYGQHRGFIELEASSEDLADNLICMWEGLRYVRGRLGIVAKPFEDPEGWSTHCVNLLFRRD